MCLLRCERGKEWVSECEMLKVKLLEQRKICPRDRMEVRGLKTRGIKIANSFHEKNFIIKKRFPISWLNQKFKPAQIKMSNKFKWAERAYVHLLWTWGRKWSYLRWNELKVCKLKQMPRLTLNKNFILRAWIVRLKHTSLIKISWLKYAQNRKY